MAKIVGQRIVKFKVEGWNLGKEEVDKGIISS
jgi:hypothetical protein